MRGLFTCYGLGPQEIEGVSMPSRCVPCPLGKWRTEPLRGDGHCQLNSFSGASRGTRVAAPPLGGGQTGEDQAVLLSSEPGIGKSRLVQRFNEQVLAEGTTRIKFRCSPYHQNSAFYPIIEHLQQLLQFAPKRRHRPSSPNSNRRSPAITSRRPIRCRWWRPYSRCPSRKALSP